MRYVGSIEHVARLIISGKRAERLNQGEGKGMWKICEVSFEAA